MYMGRNRRLANVKTRHETGLDYITQKLNIETPFGKKVLKDNKPFFPGEEEELREELNRVEALVEYVKNNKRTIELLSEVFMEVKDASRTAERAEKSVLTALEIYEIKSLLLLMEKYMKMLQSEETSSFEHSNHCCLPGQEKEGTETVGGNIIPERYHLRDMTDLLDALDPRGDRINTFYIYDEFSPKLGEIRKAKREIEISIRKEQKVKRDEIHKQYGIMLTPKFDIVISKSHPDFEKLKEIEALEMTDQDYMSATFVLKPNDRVFELQREIDKLAVDMEEEEERICAMLSKKIAARKEDLFYNCDRIGEFDFALAKAKYAIKHDCVKPEIVDEHIIEFEEGRNLQVEDILNSKGKKYCPISIALKDGVTCITGANMGGKTISLKLSGQIPILAQYGFFVPAKSAKIGLSNFMQMLIGDSQSVERGLSSFGSEMEELKEILDNSVDRSLILIDEIASGTNPVEGLALSRALVDYLVDKPYITLFTTHFETVTETDNVVNLQVVGLANCDFTLLNREIQYANRRERINIISKYMDYRLRRVEENKQVPKDALNIAKMLGLSNEIIDRAKNYIK
ncbi:MAG: DNA mismatch repair protein MutS [Firmicutes bacterium]|nr:DNA mismatch repair protein MutS [Bacillota bacterium]MBR4023800.1 DNA mismatch repair protein MutS [Bacillota bacterium]